MKQSIVDKAEGISEYRKNNIRRQSRKKTEKRILQHIVLITKTFSVEDIISFTKKRKVLRTTCSKLELVTKEQVTFSNSTF